MLTQKDYHKSLQSVYWPGRFVCWLLQQPIGARIFIFFSSINAWLNKCGCRKENLPVELVNGMTGKRSIDVRIFRSRETNKKPDELPAAVLYLHGGGYMVGYPEEGFQYIEQYVKRRNVVVIAPDYRRSVDAPYPAGFDDCYGTLEWMYENAETLGIQRKFIIAGHSAGGGLTAAVVLKAVRENPKLHRCIAFQVPIYPMLDHRGQTKSAQEMDGAPLWDSAVNKYAWGLYLSGLDRSKPVPIYASPALNGDYRNFPPTIVYVADLEPFRDETIEYVEGLKKAGVPHKFLVLEGGVYHAVDLGSPWTEIGKRALNFELDNFEEYYDKYVAFDNKKSQ